MMNRDNDKVVDAVVSIFLEARKLAYARRPHGRNVTFEVEAYELLMGCALLLGPAGVAEVMLILEEEKQSEVPVTESQVASATEFVFRNRPESPPQTS
jgi:hypothetical protein